MKDTLQSFEFIKVKLKEHCISNCLYLPEDVQQALDENKAKWLNESLDIEITKTKEELCLK